MAIRKYKPTTNGRRNMSVLVYNEEITTDTPEKSLLVPLNKKAGRDVSHCLLFWGVSFVFVLQQ